MYPWCWIYREKIARFSPTSKKGAKGPQPCSKVKHIEVDMIAPRSSHQTLSGKNPKIGPQICDFWGSKYANSGKVASSSLPGRNRPSDSAISASTELAISFYSLLSLPRIPLVNLKNAHSTASAKDGSFPITNSKPSFGSHLSIFPSPACTFAHWFSLSSPSGTSTTTPSPVISEYDDTRDQAQGFFEGGWCTGDADLAVEIIVDIVRGDGKAKGKEWPTYLVFGPGGDVAIKSKCEKMVKVLDEWKDVTGVLS
ncbi:uncharacterized protein EV420DRAFT_1480171 [Desarmillaria tabescens]|uniref:Uncharacterized protein n=1 Tax=Armillaria tabescens TaxID=1929756 RepID=A0AA39KDR3_ARMTA|nr:uncharacterized protein EV420DRAFT_1480171 [Desarmillaria tabescens]KAK0457991.1 hypothetical protein EV420DRAFT_1480171 [Desarmillaria tabescens]